MFKINRSYSFITLAVIATVLGVFVFGGQSVFALSGSEFRANRIIDDGLFYNGNSMTADQVQTFLNAKLPVCDTNGEKNHGYHYNSSTGRVNNSADPWVTTSRAIYGQRYNAWHGVTYAAAPFTCLKDFRQSYTARSDSGLCAYVPEGINHTAAQIIDTVSRACNISQKALIVTLQKEQSLVTDDWPWPTQFEKAMGYYCPDDPNNPGWCHPDYAGFFNQVYNAAKQFNRYKQFPENYNHAVNRTSHVAYQANAPSCGGTNLTMETASTAGLYNYTPYQPNAAALDNLYGLGDGCSAYGNRNFWRMWNDWFGSTQTDVPYAWAIESQEAYIDSSRATRFTSMITVPPNEKIYLRIRAQNIGNQTWDSSFVNLGTSSPADRQSIFKDTSWLNDGRPAALAESTVAPGQTGTFNFTLTAPSTPGSYREYFNVVADGHTWLNDYGLHYDINVVNPVTSSASSTNLAANEKLIPGQYMLSPDGHSVLIMQTDGNLVLYQNFLPVWNSQTAGSNAKHLVMQMDGNLVLYDINDIPLWSSGTDATTGVVASLQTDGNLVIYNSTAQPLWNVANVHVPNHLAFVNSILPIGNLYPSQQIETADRKFRLVLQGDGNLVLYSPNRAIWNSGTVGKNAAFLSMQKDGNLVIYDPSGWPIWHTRTDGKGSSHLVVQLDGNLVLYNTRNQPTWYSNTTGSN